MLIEQLLKINMLSNALQFKVDKKALRIDDGTLGWQCFQTRASLEKHLQQIGFDCIEINHVGTADPQQETDLFAPYARTAPWLKKVEKEMKEKIQEKRWWLFFSAKKPS